MWYERVEDNAQYSKSKAAWMIAMICFFGLLRIAILTGIAIYVVAGCVGFAGAWVYWVGFAIIMAVAIGIQSMITRYQKKYMALRGYAPAVTDFVEVR